MSSIFRLCSSPLSHSYRPCGPSSRLSCIPSFSFSNGLPPFLPGCPYLASHVPLRMAPIVLPSPIPLVSRTSVSPALPRRPPPPHPRLPLWPLPPRLPLHRRPGRRRHRPHPPQIHKHQHRLLPGTHHRPTHPHARRRRIRRIPSRTMVEVRAHARGGWRGAEGRGDDGHHGADGDDAGQGEL